IGQFNSRDLNQARARAVQIVVAYLEWTKHIDERTGQKLLLKTIKGKRRKAVSRYLDELTDGPREPLMEERIKRDFIRFEAEACIEQGLASGARKLNRRGVSVTNSKFTA